MGRVVSKRIWDNKKEYIDYLRHLSAYNFAKRYTNEKSILEVGCGSGYGSDFLSKYSYSILGIDILKEIIQYCRTRYVKENLSFKHIGGNKLPFADSSFDVCISFQVIEHISPNKVVDWLSEIRRVLKDGGIFILSTPNKKLRLLPFQKPWNPEHKKEYTDKELSKVLKKVFPNIQIYGLYGTEEVQAFEKERVKQNPIDVYMGYPLYCLLKTLSPSFTDFIKRFYHRLTNRESKKERKKKNENITNFFDKYTINDFKVSDETSNCIDLIGICIKGREVNK